MYVNYLKKKNCCLVLMLATFTANLAAFLTVERMQTPVQSLDQLARQSRINYTVGKKRNLLYICTR